MDVWLPGSQYAVAGSLNKVTGEIYDDVSRGFFGEVGIWREEGKGMGMGTNVCR